MNNLYLKLLAYSDKHPIGKPFNVSPFMRKNFERPKYKSDGTIGWEEENNTIAKSFLNELLERNIITYDKDKLESTIRYFPPGEKHDTENSDQWFDNTDFYVNFTIDGIKYLNDRRLVESNLKSNKASIRILGMSAMFAGLTVIITFASLLRTCNQDRAESNKDSHTKPLTQHQVLPSKEIVEKKNPTTSPAE